MPFHERIQFLQFYQLSSTCNNNYYIALHGFPTAVHYISLTTGHHRCSATAIWRSIHGISHGGFESSKCRGLPTNAQYREQPQTTKREGENTNVFGTVEFYFRHYSGVPRPYAEQSHLHPLFRLCRWPWNYLLPQRTVTDVCFIYKFVCLYNTKDICAYLI